MGLEAPPTGGIKLKNKAKTVITTGVTSVNRLMGFNSVKLLKSFIVPETKRTNKNPAPAPIQLAQLPINTIVTPNTVRYKAFNDFDTMFDEEIIWEVAKGTSNAKTAVVEKDEPVEVKETPVQGAGKIEIPKKLSRE